MATKPEAIAQIEAALNVGSQCKATSTSDLASQVLVDSGNGTLRELLQDAANAIDGLCDHIAAQDAELAAIAQPANQPVEPFRHWCETCEGMGYFDATLGSDSGLANPKQECPDCDGNGYWMPSAAPVAQPATHDLSKRLADLHLYEEIAEHYAKCAVSPEALRDWVAQCTDAPVAQPDSPVQAEPVGVVAVSPGYSGVGWMNGYVPNNGDKLYLQPVQPAAVGAVELKRYKIGYSSDEWGMRSSTPGLMLDPDGSIVRYVDAIAAIAAKEVKL